MWPGSGPASQSPSTYCLPTVYLLSTCCPRRGGAAGPRACPKITLLALYLLCTYSVLTLAPAGRAGAECWCRVLVQRAGLSLWAAIAPPTWRYAYIYVYVICGEAPLLEVEMRCVLLAQGRHGRLLDGGGGLGPVTAARARVIFGRLLRARVIPGARFAPGAIPGELPSNLPGELPGRYGAGVIPGRGAGRRRGMRRGVRRRRRVRRRRMGFRQPVASRFQDGHLWRRRSARRAGWQLRVTAGASASVAPRRAGRQLGRRLVITPPVPVSTLVH